MGDLEDGKAAAVAGLAGLAGLLVGANLSKIVAASRPVVQRIKEAASVAYNGIAKFVLRQKEALADGMARASLPFKQSSS